MQTRHPAVGAQAHRRTDAQQPVIAGDSRRIGHRHTERKGTTAHRQGQTCQLTHATRQCDKSNSGTGWHMGKVSRIHKPLHRPCCPRCTLPTAWLRVDSTAHFQRLDQRLAGSSWLAHSLWCQAPCKQASSVHELNRDDGRENKSVHRETDTQTQRHAHA